MFVSILQLMGFPMANPVHSRAIEPAQNQSVEVSEPAAKTQCLSAREIQAPVKSARRQEVKAQPGKVKVTSKVPSAPAKAASAKGAKVKPATKAATKSTAVAPACSPAKAAAPPAVKAKAKAKAAKPAGKVQSKDSVKMTTVKAAKNAPPAPKPKTASPAPSVKTEATAALVKSAASTPPPVASAPVPARAGRPSSRLAQLTVPSMAQSVASTAAKASFSQALPTPLISPPIASAIKKDPKLANNWKLKPVGELTDAELIAMPDEEYMNDTQMAYFRQKLTQLKKEILSNAGETTEHLREDTVVVPDPADRATIEEEHALELRTRDRERKLLKKIEQSIVRIDAGDYGYCDETGESIGVGRLLARPTANLSLEAQQRRELKQKMFGD